jgi:non-structural maintenance of chromosomes element 4
MADRDILMESPRKKVVYDPDQDPEEKRVLRQKYRVLLKDEEGTMAAISVHLSQEK